MGDILRLFSATSICPRQNLTLPMDPGYILSKEDGPQTEEEKEDIESVPY
jgi:hypothetical protein